jgi:hypothetical protein
MTHTWIRPVQLGLGALALSMAGWASAQPAAPADTPAPAAQKAPAKPHMGKHHRHHHRGDKAQRGYRDPAAHEAAAARDEARRGKLESKAAPDDQLQRNALARCDVFKVELDRQACTERVRNGQVSGSVEGGGTITEYTQQVPVPR